jgi:hypothetical protein
MSRVAQHQQTILTDFLLVMTSVRLTAGILMLSDVFRAFPQVVLGLAAAHPLPLSSMHNYLVQRYTTYIVDAAYLVRI